MRSIASSSVLILAALLPLAKASPAHFKRAYAEPGRITSSNMIPFDCNESIPNWVVPVELGTPGQSVNLLLDTTFDNTFVAGVMCHSEFCENQSDPLYNAGQSSTSVNLHQRRTFDLGDGEIVTGDIYKDTIDFGSVIYENATFGKAFDVQGFPPMANFAGVLGLASSVNQTTSTLNKRQEKLPTYNNDRATEGDNPGQRRQSNHNDDAFRKRSAGSGTCGFSLDFDTDSVSQEIFWLEYPTCEYGNSPFWKTDLTCVTIDDAVDLKFKNTIAEFDTTVQNIEMPQKDFQKIHEGLKATYHKSVDRWLFKCCDAKNLKISFSKYAVTIPAISWTIIEGEDEELCSAIFSISRTDITPVNRWRLGTRFITNFITISSPTRKQTGIALIDTVEEGLVITHK
ncbi:aspartic peptidase domain-containing protein [Mucor mucedo]|uniref:aspartic peptidase domain-containing protein n=1 Tax=Mucor mucedo TaxID=29922 RepID=UPI002220C06C|nr:aspartic peptidase domain-containing protein [Mucor mucedo]KAI7892268.1 aspartic peptidase domain-containing protein [Mucor mucedo]